MKKTTKILLIVLAVILTIGIAGFICADVLISRVATTQVNKVLATLPEGEASIGSISVRVFSGTASVGDIRFAYSKDTVIKKDTFHVGATISVDRIDIGRVFYTLLLKKQALVHSLTIVRPQVELWLDEQHPERSFPAFESDATRSFEFPLNKAELKHLNIKNASFALHSLSSKLDVLADSCSIALYDLVYDTAFHYCDSVYKLTLAHAAIMLPDGRMKIETRQLSHANQGPLTLGATRIANTMPKKRLGDIVKEPVTWIDMTLSSVETSAFNPLHKALAQDFSLQSVNAQVECMDIFRDERYKPKSVFLMPQTILMSIPVVFNIEHVHAGINIINIDFASTDKNIGQLSLGNIKATVKNITNKRGATLKASGTCPLQAGKANAAFEMTMNKNCNWVMDLHAENVNAALLNPFIRPLVGMTAECFIDALDTRYKGDILKADGTFRMLYHGFRVKVHKEDDIPYKIITKNANTFTALGNSLLPKSNPSSPTKQPRGYQVTWKRNEWKPFPLFLFGPCIDGVKKTMLPGLYVHLQTKEPKTAKTTKSKK